MENQNDTEENMTFSVARQHNLCIIYMYFRSCLVFFSLCCCLFWGICKWKWLKKKTMCFLKTDRCQDSKNWYIFRLNTFDQTYFEIVFCHSLIKTEIENEKKKRTAYGQLVNGYLCCFVRLFKHKTILSRRFLILQTPFVLFFYFAIYCFVTCDSSENLCQRSKAIRFLYFCFLDTDTPNKRRERKKTTNLKSTIEYSRYGTISK